jgi:hypothetical protein
MAPVSVCERPGRAAAILTLVSRTLGEGPAEPPAGAAGWP